MNALSSKVGGKPVHFHARLISSSHLLVTPNVLVVPAMGFLKLTKREIARATQPEQYSYVMVDGPRNQHYLKKDKKGEEPLVYLANNRTLIQTLVAAPRLPKFPEVPTFTDEQLGSDGRGQYEFDLDAPDDTTPLSPRKRDALSPTKKRKYRAAWEAQGESWRLQVIPALVPVFVRLWHKTRALREADALPPPRAIECNCGAAVLCTVTVVRFTSK